MSAKYWEEIKDVAFVLIYDFVGVVSEVGKTARRLLKLLQRVLSKMAWKLLELI